MKLKQLVSILSVLVGLSIASVASVAHAERVDVFGKICTPPPTANNQRTEQQKAVSQSTACKEKNPNSQNPLFGPGSVMTSVINVLSLVVAIIAVISIMIAGLRYIMGGNKPEDLSNARTRIIWALVALLVVISAQAVVRFVLAKL